MSGSSTIVAGVRGWSENDGRDLRRRQLPAVLVALLPGGVAESAVQCLEIGGTQPGLEIVERLARLFDHHVGDAMQRRGSMKVTAQGRTQRAAQKGISRSRSVAVASCLVEALGEHPVREVSVALEERNRREVLAPRRTANCQ